MLLMWVYWLVSAVCIGIAVYLHWDLDRNYYNESVTKVYSFSGLWIIWTMLQGLFKPGKVLKKDKIQVGRILILLQILCIISFIAAIFLAIYS